MNACGTEWRFPSAVRSVDAGLRWPANCPDEPGGAGGDAPLRAMPQKAERDRVLGIVHLKSYVLYSKQDSCGDFGRVLGVGCAFLDLGSGESAYRTAG